MLAPLIGAGDVFGQSQRAIVEWVQREQKLDEHLDRATVSSVNKDAQCHGGRPVESGVASTTLWPRRVL